MGRGPGRSPRSVMTTPPSDWGEGSNTPMCQHPKSTHTLQVPPQGPRSCAWPGRRSRHGQAGWGHGRGSSDPLLTTGHREDRTRGCSPSSSPEAQQRPRNGRATERSARGVAVFKQHLTGVSGPDTGGRSRPVSTSPPNPSTLQARATAAKAGSPRPLCLLSSTSSPWPVGRGHGATPLGSEGPAGLGLGLCRLPPSHHARRQKADRSAADAGRRAGGHGRCGRESPPGRGHGSMCLGAGASPWLWDHIRREQNTGLSSFLAYENFLVLGGGRPG